MEKYKNQIISGNIEQIIDNSTIILMIEAYCMLNNIEIKEIEDFEKDIIDLEYYDLTDSVKTYLKEAGRRPLLSIEEEQKLLKRILQGDDYAREVFIESNLRLVINISKKYVDKGLPFLDLIQEGNIGLMTAVDRFDINKKTRFSTYATCWIKQAITRSIADKGRNVRIPVYLHEKIVIYQRTVINLESKLNRKPTLNEIANEMKLSISEVIKLQKLQDDTVSMNMLVGKDEDTELENFIPENKDTLEDIATTNIMQQQVRKLLEDCNLKPRETEILILRFGLSGERPMKLEEIGKKFGITRERVRQIEATALMKIRKSRYIKALSDYMPNPATAIKNIDFFREEYSKSANARKSLIKEVNNQQQEDKDAQKESKPTEKKRKLQTIYEYFNTYTKEQVDEMLGKLTEEERALITLRYGEDLNNPVPGKLSKDENYKFYYLLVPKMKRLLARLKKETKPNKNSKVEESKPIVAETPVIPAEKPATEIKDKNNNITKEDYIRMLELLKTPTFNQMLGTLTVKESVIISLRLGYIDGKYFSTESIAEFLGIEIQEVIEATKKVLLLYKENINQYIDMAIKTVSNEPNQLTRKK